MSPDEVLDTYPPPNPIYNTPQHTTPQPNLTKKTDKKRQDKMKLQPIPLFLSLSLLFILPTHAQNRTCYFLDGSVATADVPCTSDATTNCCNKNDICMSNGLCYLQGSHGMSLSRGSCTDKSWGARCFAPCCMFHFSFLLSSFFFLYDFGCISWSSLSRLIYNPWSRAYILGKDNGTNRRNLQQAQTATTASQS